LAGAVYQGQAGRQIGPLPAKSLPQDIQVKKRPLFQESLGNHCNNFFSGRGSRPRRRKMKIVI